MDTRHEDFHVGSHLRRHEDRRMEEGLHNSLDQASTQKGSTDC